MAVKEQERRFREADRNPDPVIQRYNELERLAGQEIAKEAGSTLSQYPEIKTAADQIERSKGVLSGATRERRQFELDHPIKAKTGLGQISKLRQAEQEARKALNRAKKEHGRAWDDPKLQQKAVDETNARNRAIVDARNELEQLKPLHEVALRAKERENQRSIERRQDERLENWVRDRDPGAEYRGRIEDLQKHYGRRFDPEKADWVVSKDLAKEGFSPGQIKKAMLENSPAIGRQDKKQREQYVKQTVSKVMRQPDVKEHRREMSMRIERSMSWGMSL